ncbi:hypothetical protein N7532_006427 [Penicillium argentinense]|uniref:Uncharacterized protein n=1 Tax=Penicillium argentinense TaxID=1131581 RepID=A0A9W9FFW9_9EURO|nr:uncharacterized protein N7532_006427 [Penicillium argentinense]KAJ5099426.1 hypothetical protein N7532_006427 [Penicillium argentinense]
MATLWFCCGCQFGPHNAALYDSCINCGDRRCAACVEEKVVGSDALRAHSHDHGHCHATSPYPSAVALDTSHTLPLDTRSMSVALPELPGVRPLSRLRPTPQTTLFGGVTQTYSQTYMYICCQCHDGPKVYNVQPQCVNCNHMACSVCTYVK